MPLSAGTYNWQAAYSGDSANASTSSTCGSETLTVAKATPSITTTLSALNVAPGTAIHDSAKLTAATNNAAGTVTYSIYAGTACSGTPVFTAQVSVANGVVPDSSSFTPLTAGTYAWQAAYGGDGANMSTTSLCGSETLTVTAAIVGNQGCSPGFWKNHPTDWVGYQPTQTVGSVFTGVDSSLSASTLQAALDFKGGSSLAGAEQTLLRSAVAGLLNASNPSVQFALTPNALISQVNTAIAQAKRDAILILATALDTDNNGGCPIS
jgi:hypothetical protein